MAVIIVVIIAAAFAGATLFANDDEYQFPPHYDDATTALFVHTVEDGASVKGNQVRLPSPPPLLRSVQLFAAANNDVRSPLDEQRLAGTPSSASANAILRQLGQNGDQSNNDEDDNRFERARTLMRVEYERISAQDTNDATTLDLSVAPLLAPVAGHPSPSSGPLEPIVEETAERQLTPAAAAAIPNNSTTGSSGDSQGRVNGSQAGQTLFVCGATLFLLAMMGLAIGFVNRRRSNRQSYPCWERELRNGLASPSAL